MNKVDYKSN